MVHKSQDCVNVTFFSDSLHSELVTLLGSLDTADFQLQQPHHQSTLNGLVLLKHYPTLLNRLAALRSVSS